jgi:hypothetical protein
MHEIFISYKREDQHVARQLADTLEEHGCSVWWDPKLRAGELFDDAIERALEESRVVIVIWSDASIQSQYVKDEASYALDHGKLMPVSVDAVEPPFRFRRVQTADFSDRNFRRDAPSFRKLINDIRTRIDGRPGKPEIGKTLPETVGPNDVPTVGAPELAILEALDNPEYSRGRRTVGGLAQELRVDRGEVEEYLTKLAEDGFVRNSGKHWTITLSGRALLNN